MKVKFHLLPPGQAFLWRGAQLNKSGPVTATDAEGKQVMVPRSATVTLSESTPPEYSVDREAQLDLARKEFRSDLKARLDALSGRIPASEIASLATDINGLVDDLMGRATPGDAAD